MERVIETDVVVVGAGPTGLTAANLMARHGVDVTVLEQRPSTGDEPRAISITDEALRVMQQVGIVDQLCTESLQDTGARYFGRRGQLLAETHPGPSALGQPAKSQFDQPVLEALLGAAAQENERVTPLFSTVVESLEDHGTHVDVRAVRAEGPATVRARWLIGCDGGRSEVRSQLGISLDGSTQVEKWIVVDLLNTGEHERFSEFHCNGTRPTVVVPGVRGRCRFEFMLLPGEDDRQMITPEKIEELLRPYLGRSVRPEDVRRGSVYIAHQRIAHSYRKGRVLLAGDAAHLMPPFAGQGLNAGVRDAANLAWKVAAEVKGTGTDALVATYEAERRPHAVEMIKLSRRIGRVVMSCDNRVTFLRDGLARVLDLTPAAKAWIAEMKFLGQPHFTVGCIATASTETPPEVAALVGRTLPQPWVRMEEGTAVKLDELLGDEWCLLRLGTGTPGSLEIVPLGHQPRGHHSKSVLDLSRDLTHLTSRPASLLVRPDRYVAAVTDPAHEAEALVGLSTLVPSLSGYTHATTRAAS